MPRGRFRTAANRNDLATDSHRLGLNEEDFCFVMSRRNKILRARHEKPALKEEELYKGKQLWIHKNKEDRWEAAGGVSWIEVESAISNISTLLVILFL